MSILFNGSTQSVVTSAGPVLRNIDHCTLMAWVKLVSLPSSTGFIYQVEGSAGNASRASIGVTPTGLIEVRGRAPDSESFTTILSVPAISTGVWTHIAAVIHYDSDTGDVFINGAAVSTTGSFIFTNTFTDNTDSLRSSIGAGDNGAAFFLNAEIEDIRCYERELTANEINTIYSSRGKDSIVFGLDARYCAVGPENVAVTAECDLSVLKLNGTANNSPTWRGSPLSRR